MRVVADIVYFVVSSLFICCAAQTEKRWPHEVFAPPYQLLSVRAEKYILPLLSYEVGALEPYIDRETVVAHYEGHHEAYRRKMNVALNSWREDVSLTGAIFCTVILINRVCLMQLLSETSFKLQYCSKFKNADQGQHGTC